MLKRFYPALYAALFVAACLATSAEAATPSFGTTPSMPTYARVLPAYGVVTVPARVCPHVTDMHAYGIRSGRALRQRRHPIAGTYWTTGSGIRERARSGYSRENCEFYSFSRMPVIVAVWADMPTVALAT